MILKRIDPLSAAKIVGVLYTLLGLLFGLGAGAVMMLGLAVGSATRQPSALGALSGVAGFLLFLVAFTIFYGLIGFLFALIGAWIYNVLAKSVGGVRLEFETVAPAYPAPSYMPPPILPQEGL